MTEIARLPPNDDMDEWHVLADTAFLMDGGVSDLHELADRVRTVLVVFPPCDPKKDFPAYALGWFLSNVLEALEREMKKRDH